MRRVTNKVFSRVIRAVWVDRARCHGEVKELVNDATSRTRRCAGARVSGVRRTHEAGAQRGPEEASRLLVLRQRPVQGREQEWALRGRLTQIIDRAIRIVVARSSIQVRGGQLYDSSEDATLAVPSWTRERCRDTIAPSIREEAALSQKTESDFRLKGKAFV